jgi:hypothetical protein
MVQATDPRQHDHLPELPRHDQASDRRVAVEPHVRAALLVVGGVLADQVQEMTLCRKVLQRCPRPRAKCLGRYLATVRGETRQPSFASSPAIRSSPHDGCLATYAG